MCWSGEASAALATVGFGTAGYVAYKGESKELWIPLVYFACMVLPILRSVSSCRSRTVHGCSCCSICRLARYSPTG